MTEDRNTKSSPHFCNIYYCVKQKEENPKRYVQKLLEYGFRESFGVSYSGVKVVKGPYGKPLVQDLKGIYFNISHGHRIVALACANVLVGVDTESSRKVQERTIKRSCSKRELEWLGQSIDRQKDFLKLWTLKESYVKMVGEGLRIPLRDVEILFEKTEDIEKIYCNRGGLYRQYFLTEGILSVCIEEADMDLEKVKIKIQKLIG